MSEIAMYAMDAVMGIILGELIAYFWREKKWLGVVAVLALLVMELVRCVY